MAATVAVMLLSVQIGLAFHGTAHTHEAGQPGDCHVCDLGTHFVAEPASGQDFDSLPRVARDFPDEYLAFPESPLLNPLARGPPLTSI